MREIKFRAYDSKMKRYHYWDSKTNLYYGIFWSMVKRPEFRNGVEQFSGLKDKNGVEIYEGDIVSGVLYKDYTEHIGKILFDFNCYMIVTEDKSMQLDLPELLTVIGNIHQDNNLLEAK